MSEFEKTNSLFYINQDQKDLKKLWEKTDYENLFVLFKDKKIDFEAYSKLTPEEAYDLMCATTNILISGLQNASNVVSSFEERVSVLEKKLS